MIESISTIDLSSLDLDSAPLFMVLSSSHVFALVVLPSGNYLAFSPDRPISTGGNNGCTHKREFVLDNINSGDWVLHDESRAWWK